MIRTTPFASIAVASGSLMSADPSPELVRQRMRLNIIDCLEGSVDLSTSDEALFTCYEFLIEDLCFPEAVLFEASLDGFLVDDTEREAARTALPLLRQEYLDWDLSKSQTPRQRRGHETTRRAAAHLLDAMLKNAHAQADAVRERQEEGQ